MAEFQSVNFKVVSFGPTSIYRLRPYVDCVLAQQHITHVFYIYKAFTRHYIYIYICYTQRGKTLNERKKQPERVVAISKQPQRVLACQEMP
jgi:hypothetical protein